MIGSDGGAVDAPQHGPVRVRLDSKAVKITSRNILAQTTTGSPDNIVMAGAHLDSVS
ncbi:peptidase M28, partial [Mycolicibacterium insubricum]|nr:peptidase M28 [Mycolicibacterium insubricum]